MNCEEFHLLLVDDEGPEDPALREHAGLCPECATLLREHRILLDSARALAEDAPEPPARVEARLRQAIAAETGFPRLLARWLGPVPALRVALAAALVLVAAIGIYRLLPRPIPGGEEETLASLYERIGEAERSYVEAVAALDAQAAPILARAADPDLAPRNAAILMSYRDRLAHLDSVIAEVRSFLAKNPGHSGGHKVLIAAYREKTQVLQQVTEISPGEKS